MQGIYRILNTKNGKSYIGMSFSIYQRMSNHRSRLRKGNHKNPHLQASWNKHGEANFQFTIIEKTDGLNKTQLVEREDFYIKLFQSNAYGRGYNVCLSDRVEKRKKFVAESNSFEPVFVKEYNRFLNFFKVRLSDEQSIACLYKLSETLDYMCQFFKEVQDNNFKIAYKNRRANITVAVRDPKNKKTPIVFYVNKTSGVIETDIDNLVLSNNFVAFYPNTGKVKHYKKISIAVKEMGIKMSYDAFRTLLKYTDKRIKSKSNGGTPHRFKEEVIFIYKETFENPVYNQAIKDLSTPINKNKKVKDKEIVYLEKNKEGEIIGIFRTPQDIFKKYSTLNSKGIKKAIYGEKKSYKGLYFERQVKHLNV